MNSRHFQNAKRLIAGLAIIAALLSWMPIAFAGSTCDADCEMACCQNDSSDTNCCGDDATRNCPAVSSIESRVWLPTKKSDDLPSNSVIVSSSLARDDRFQTPSIMTSFGIAPSSVSLVDLHVRLQI